jgi:hypothetical protein
MTLLRILKNLAVLVILTVAALSLNPRPVAAQSSCRPLGAGCTSSSQCCSGSLCGWRHTCCDRFFRHQTCTSSAQCCSGLCVPVPGYPFGQCW